ncbi:MAG: histidine kinase [Pseudohongiellaceae bacterium]
MGNLRFRYQTFEFGESDIHLRSLRDRQQFFDPDEVSKNLGICSASWPLFGVVWQSAQVLAHLMLEYDIAGKRILEIGCGMALPSLVLNQRAADITATDHHPEAEAFLRENTRINTAPEIPFLRTSWSDETSDLGRFDLLLGSDILYEQNHPELLAQFIDRHAQSTSEVIIVDPGRRQHARFSKKMVGLGFRHSQSAVGKTDYLDEPYKGQIIKFQRG